MICVQKNGLSHGALAEYLDVSRQSASKWETGQSIPDVNKIVKLSEIFHVTVDYLVKDNDDLENEQVECEYEQKRKNKFETSRNIMPGYIFIATGLLLVGISFVFTAYTSLFAIIVFILGVEWVLVKSNMPLVIAWTILLISVCIFNPWTTGVSTMWIINAIMFGTVYIGIVIGIIQRVFGIIVLFVTVKKIINHVK